MSGAGLGLVGLLIAVADLLGLAKQLERHLAQTSGRAATLLPWHRDRPEDPFEYMMRLMGVGFVGAFGFGCLAAVFGPNNEDSAPIAALNFLLGTFFASFLLWIVAVGISLWSGMFREAFSLRFWILLIPMTIISVAFGPMYIVFGVLVLGFSILLSAIFKIPIPKPLACVGLALAILPLLA